jgi:NAD(P)-dependent dehydrogenase (short-subunit alcohol dehydrogenase family)
MEGLRIKEPFTQELVIPILQQAAMRLEGKTAIVIGAGQGPGEGMGNGRATVLRFAQEGAKVMAVDRDLASAEETVSMVKQGGGECVAFEADVTKEAALAAAIAAAQKRWGRICITMSASASLAAMRRCSTSPRRLSTGSAPSTCAAPSWLASTSSRSCGSSVRAPSS